MTELSGKARAVLGISTDSDQIGWQDNTSDTVSEQMSTEIQAKEEDDNYNEWIKALEQAREIDEEWERGQRSEEKQEGEDSEEEDEDAATENKIREGLRYRANHLARPVREFDQQQELFKLRLLEEHHSPPLSLEEAFGDPGDQPHRPPHYLRARRPDLWETRVRRRGFSDQVTDKTADKGNAHGVDSGSGAVGVSKTNTPQRDKARAKTRLMLPHIEQGERCSIRFEFYDSLHTGLSFAAIKHRVHDPPFMPTPDNPYPPKGTGSKKEKPKTKVVVVVTGVDPHGQAVDLDVCVGDYILGINGKMLEPNGRGSPRGGYGKLVRAMKTIDRQGGQQQGRQQQHRHLRRPSLLRGSPRRRRGSSAGSSASSGAGSGGEPEGQSTLPTARRRASEGSSSGGTTSSYGGGVRRKGSGATREPLELLIERRSVPPDAPWSNRTRLVQFLLRHDPKRMLVVEQLLEHFVTGAAADVESTRALQRALRRTYGDSPDLKYEAGHENNGKIGQRAIERKQPQRIGGGVASQTRKTGRSGSGGESGGENGGERGNEGIRPSFTRNGHTRALGVQGLLAASSSGGEAEVQHEGMLSMREALAENSTGSAASKATVNKTEFLYEATFTEPSLGVRFSEGGGRMQVIRVMDQQAANGIACNGYTNKGGAADVRIGDCIVGVNGEKLPADAVKEDLVKMVMHAGRPVVLQLMRCVSKSADSKSRPERGGLQTSLTRCDASTEA
jgi:hypothetical protein